MNSSHPAPCRSMASSDSVESGKEIRHLSPGRMEQSKRSPPHQAVLAAQIPPPVEGVPGRGQQRARPRRPEFQSCFASVQKPFTVKHAIVYKTPLYASFWVRSSMTLRDKACSPVVEKGSVRLVDVTKVPLQGRLPLQCSSPNHICRCCVRSL